MMDAIRRVLVVIVPLLLAFVVNRRFNVHWMRTGPVEQKRFEMHPTRGAFGSRHQERIPRLYIISGGAGFTGSWIARYLLLRGEKHVHLVDRALPAPDLLKHGATHHDVDLSDPASIEPLIKRLIDRTHSTTHIIVYNCCVVKRYWAPNFRVDLGVSASETFFVALRLFQKDQVTLIHVGDTLAHRSPVKNLDRVWPTEELWNQTTAGDTVFGFGEVRDEDSDEEERDRAFSSYAWHQLAVERIVLQLQTLQPSVRASAVLRVEGFLTGHVGDGLLDPCIRANVALLHSPNTAVTLVHVEDVARACLSLEHLLMDPATKNLHNGKQFTIGSDQVTTMQHVFDYIKTKRPGFRLIHIQPILVFILTSIISVFMSIIKITLNPARSSTRQESLFLSLPYTLTFSRFYTVQVGQVPNPDNKARQQEVLGVHNNFSLSHTLDMICEEVRMIESQSKDSGRKSR